MTLGSNPKIILLGNLGYVGPVVTAALRKSYPGAELIGMDPGYFSDRLTTHDAWPERHLNRQIIADIRDIDASLFEGADAVVALAAVSNDPMGARFEAVTQEINQDAVIRAAHLAAAAGVSRFVFASSCSVYGFAEGDARSEDAPLNPLTAYARSKIGAERALETMDAPGMLRTALRFATACGPSPRLRLDLVLNDFAACAVTAGKITVLSDGSPWRPLIDVRDMARAIDWAISRSDAAGGQWLAVNAGSDAWNYQIRDLAQAVVDAVPGASYSINPDASPDNRSYRVDFSLYGQLAPDHQPIHTLAGTIGDLVKLLNEIGFRDSDFRSSPLMRLKALEQHIQQGTLGEDLRWRLPQ
ncbi:SDR family oxidoreductase [Ruegeria sediminis]|uniref:SDR family oxidoreductase n=1 Tax=Ruegeria sediminis TaxID=2583820 RepID=A0ABY2WW98_9RHOB|nr:SDR family oxidoreductase [Ruegeria sediminis]TMV07031.1 SDR family oxidoreductase [Ruegeria sediminis]